MLKTETRIAADWKPIASAPKDGTEILVYGRVPPAGLFGASPYMDAPSAMGVVRWTEREYPDFEPAGDGLYREVKRSHGSWASRFGLGGGGHITHWMPLPLAPIETRSDETPKDGSAPRGVKAG